MIDDDDGRQRGEKILQLGQIVHLEIHHDVPAELLDSRRDAVEYVARGEIDQPFEEVETHATDAGRVHPFQFAVGHLFADEGNALGAPFGGFERIDHRPVVLAVAGRLNNHVLVEAKKIAQRE